MRNSNSGAVLIELVFVLPILVILSFGAFELHRIITLNTNIKTVAYKLGLWASRGKDLNDCVKTLSDDNRDLNIGTDCSVNITGLTAGQGTENIKKWCRSWGAEPSSVTSSYPVLYHPTFFQTSIDNIVIEISYKYTPLLFQFASKTLKYQVCVDYRGVDFPTTPSCT